MLLRILILAVASVTALNLIDDDPLLECELLGDCETTNDFMVNLKGDYRIRKIAEREAKREERK